MEVCIICPLSNSNPNYSIAGVIRNQVKMLSKHGHRVTIIVNSDFDGVGFPSGTLLKILPTTTLVDYTTKLAISKEHEEFATEVATILSPRLINYDVIFTHDLIFTGWYLPFALGLMSIADENPELPFFHWIHSDPTIQPLKDWWDARHYSGNYNLVYPTAKPIKDIERIFNTTRVIHIPHIINLSHLYRFSDQSKDIIKLLPALYTSDAIQIYPASTDRLEAKGARELINLFGLLKRSGRSVCLVIANQFSQRVGGRMVDPILYYEKVARRCGLEPYEDFIFTSELFNGKYAEGLPQRVLFELMTLSNLCVLPSKSESFGLGLLEALAVGSCVCVANEHLNLPIKQYTSFDFKAFNETDQFVDLSSLSTLVDWIIEQLDSNSVVRAKTKIRQDFNPTAIYNDYYKPLFSSIPAAGYTPTLPKRYLDI